MRGLCSKHGGYTRCREEGCEKQARAGGLCKAHGGGKRCKVNDCKAIARGGNMCCKEHTNQAEIDDAARNITAIGNARSILNGGTMDHILIPRRSSYLSSCQDSVPLSL